MTMERGKTKDFTPGKPLVAYCRSCGILIDPKDLRNMEASVRGYQCWSCKNKKNTRDSR